MLEADLYLNQIDFCRYWAVNAATLCHDFIEQVKAGEARIEDCHFLTPHQVRAFKMALETEDYLPSIPMTTVPLPIKADLLPVNEPDSSSLVIVSGNNSLTLELLTTIWAQGVTPAYFLLVDCRGSTVDMAMIYGDFTPERLRQALEKGNLEEKTEHRRMVVPGLTLSLAEDFERATGWEMEVGPVCAVELPLFLGERWIFPDHS
jgi:hypothetical protein